MNSFLLPFSIYTWNLAPESAYEAKFSKMVWFWDTLCRVWLKTWQRQHSQNVPRKCLFHHPILAPEFESFWRITLKTLLYDHPSLLHNLNEVVYSVSTLETTIFCQIGSNFRRIFSEPFSNTYLWDKYLQSKVTFISAFQKGTS